MAYKRSRNWMAKALIYAIVVLSICFGLYPMFMGFHSFEFLGLTEGGARGDFFGGHFGPAIGSWTLAVVILTSYVQISKQNEFSEKQRLDSEQFFFHQSFVDGLNLIAQWDMREAGCPQAMRLLDYYSRVALDRRDKELLLLLNTVITDQIRANLRAANGDKSRRDNYMFAVDALTAIGLIREAEAKAYKQAKNNPSTPSAD